MRPAPDMGHREALRWVAGEIKPRSYLEVGVREGHSLAAVLRASDPERLVLCDTWGNRHGGTGRGNHDHIERLLDVLGFTGEVEWHDTVSSMMWASMPGACDLVHIDGDHSYEGALFDIRKGWMATGRAMVVHDVVASEPVSRAAKDLGYEPAHVFTGDAGTGVWIK